MTYFHITGKVRFDVDTDPLNQMPSWVITWNSHEIIVDGLFSGGDEIEAKNNAVDNARGQVETRSIYMDIEYDSDTLVATEETPEETDERERLAAYSFMVRSGTPRLFDKAVANG